MSVLGTISLSGLTTTNSDYIQCGEIEVTQALIVDPGATVTLPNNSIADAALSSNVALKNAANIFTNDNNFTTTAVDDVNLQINYTNTKNVAFCPNTSGGFMNPYCQNGDVFLGGDPGGSLGVVVGRRDRYNAIRFTDTSLNVFADVEMNFFVGVANCMSLYISDISFNVRSNFYEPTIMTAGPLRDIPLLTLSNTINSSFLKLYSVCNNDYTNPLVNNNDTLISSNGPAGSALTICRETTNGTGIRMDATTLKNQASGSIQFWVTGAPSASYSQFDSAGKLVLQDGFEVNGTSLLSNALNVGGRSNEFVNDVYCGSTVKSVGGLFIETALGVAVASINSAGNVSAPTANITTITTTTQANADNSTKCATTAFVKNQNYASLSATQTFTGLNTFSTGTVNAQPVKIQSTGLIANNPFIMFVPACTATAYNPIVQANDSLISLSDTSNSPTTSLCMAVHSGAYSGIRLGPLNTDIYSKSTLSQYIWDSTVFAKRVFEYQAATNISYTNFDYRLNLLPPSSNQATTSKHVGFQITPTITTPTTNLAQSIANIVFDNATNNSYGTYFFEYNITVNTAVAGEIKAALNTTNANMAGNYRASVYTPAVGFDSNLSNQCIVKIYTTQTWHLNFHVPVSAYTYVNGLFRITRLS